MQPSERRLRLFISPSRGELGDERAGARRSGRAAGRDRPPPDREAWTRTIHAGLLPHFEPDVAVSLAEVGRTVELFRADGNDFGLATALGLAGTITMLLGHAEEGIGQLDEVLAAAESVGLPSLIGANLTLGGRRSMLSKREVPRLPPHASRAAT
jgi:hypothetical protein